MSVYGSIYARLVAQFGDRLGRYANAPAVFRDLPPADWGWDGACVVISTALGSRNQDDSSTSRRADRVNLRLYIRTELAGAGFDGLCLDVRRAFHRRLLEVGADEMVEITAIGPGAAPTSGPEVEGQIVELSYLIEETAL